MIITLLATYAKLAAIWWPVLLFPIVIIWKEKEEEK